MPDLSASMGATYPHRFAGDSRAIFHVDYLYESPTRMVDGLQGFPAGFSDQFKRTVNQLNASFTFALSNGLELGVWGRNLTNARYPTKIFPAGAQSGSASGYPSQQRTHAGPGRIHSCIGSGGGGESGGGGGVK